MKALSRILGSDGWKGWQLYLTITSSLLAGLGIVFGTLEPLLSWLTLSRALIWAVVSVSTVAVGCFLVHAENRKTPRVESKAYISKFVVLGVFWALFPYLLCTGSRVMGESERTCFCDKLPPTVEIELGKYGTELRVADKVALSEILKKTKAEKPVTPVFKHPRDVDVLLSALSSKDSSERDRDFASSWRQEERMIAATLLRLIAGFSGSPLPASELSKEYQERMKFQLRAEGGFTVISGDQVLEWLQAMVQSGTRYEPQADEGILERSEERRVGREGRSRGS